jgi:hypothetical protein
MRASRVVVLAVALAMAAGTRMASGQGLVVAQSDEQSHAIDLASVERLPAVEQQVSFLTGHGTEQATYTGALLWSLLENAGTLGGEPRARIRRTVAVTGRDGYVAVLALAEIDPEFEGKQVIVAYRKDGQPMPGSELRLVVPGDRRGGRSVRDVVRIELR